ncbi:hypothetical protein OIV83_004142 [Microbotryomycetes sp. JL201]|nr:hypothetical protein OIV83_004142 [Microbotryomycetes sp. JL201]
MTAPWRRVVRFIAKEDGKEYYGEPQLGPEDDVGLAYHDNRRITVKLLSSSPIDARASLTNQVRTVSRLLSPLKREEIVTIRGMAAQYHPNDGKRVAKPEIAALFYKPVSTLCGPEDKVLLPEYTRTEGTEDYEVELCVVIGKKGRNVPLDKALDHVLGYCTVNDMTGRDKLKKGGQAGFAKSYDTWTPLGPVLVHPSQIKDPMNLEVRTTVNGEAWQSSNTCNMVLNIAELIHRLSQGTTLEPGSIIMTGSPLAPNHRPGAPFLKDGDEMRLWQVLITDLIVPELVLWLTHFVGKSGTLINKVVDESRSPKAKL